MITEPDRQYVTFGVMFDLEHILAKDISLIRRRHSESSGALQVTRLDYRVVPLSITIVSLASLEDDKHNILSWDQVTHDAANMPAGTFHLVLVIIPEDAMARKILRL